MAYYLESSGIEFEGELLEKFGNVSVKEWGNGAFKLSSVKQDRFEGTDCFVLGMPIDVTLDFERKDYMKVSSRFIDLQFGKIKFGVRFGNSHSLFKIPTLVIGVDTQINRQNMLFKIELLSDYIREILETGMDYYWEIVEG